MVIYSIENSKFLESKIALYSELVDANFQKSEQIRAAFWLSIFEMVQHYCESFDSDEMKHSFIHSVGWLVGWLMRLETFFYQNILPH